jgi:sensor c-di-GMP phosphodiesterase-like protein
MFIFTALLGFIPKLLDYKLRKQELQLSWFQLILSVGKDLFKFIGAHIKFFIVLAILTIGLTHYISLKRAISAAKSETIVAKKALIAHVESDRAEAVKREALNKLNAMLAQKKTDASEAAHKAELSMIIKKGKQNEIISNRDISNARSQLLHAVEGYEAKRLLENDTDRLTSADDHATIFRQLQDELAVCKEAGAIAAADYNYCKSYVDIQQSVIGVQDEH